ncbi:hypothetical protein LamDB_16770 [Bacillus anthracis]|uniref:Uncharacterized protein n=1 Tax=Bacillus anthracis TaxID=1392 RepID=A0A640N7J0_BACAN|nr:hypothetical protein BA5240_2766 [Bacillus anthracis]GEU06573.1 hypothetical protein HG1_20580 [Bacillus anthracis]GEU20850.1 hypothetical protein LamDB_16770 [Bacillus anthracis]
MKRGVYYEFLSVDTKILTTNKKIAFMINRPLNIRPAKPPANPSPTFSPIMCKVAKKTMGAARMKIPLDIFHICLYFFAIKKIRALKAIRSKRNIMNEFIISSFW